jgi:hypothetical protein
MRQQRIVEPPAADILSIGLRSTARMSSTKPKPFGVAFHEGRVQKSF